MTPIPCVVVLQEGLAGNFCNAEVTVGVCPDLSQLPWGLAAPGVSMSEHTLVAAA